MKRDEFFSISIMVHIIPFENVVSLGLFDIVSLHEKEIGRKPRSLEFHIASHEGKDGSYMENLASKDFMV